MAEFIARSATENVEETLAAEIAGALVVAVAVEETGTNTKQKNRPSLGGFFVVNFSNLIFVL
ncbi:hypothetical protein D4R51_00630 [bacterium]|nr:MAG: hypothetical protein D4R51_00630 [bacterium]